MGHISLECGTFSAGRQHSTQGLPVVHLSCVLFMRSCSKLASQSTESKHTTSPLAVQAQPQPRTACRALDLQLTHLYFGSSDIETLGSTGSEPLPSLKTGSPRTWSGLLYSSTSPGRRSNKVCATQDNQALKLGQAVLSKATSTFIWYIPSAAAV